MTFIRSRFSLSYGAAAPLAALVFLLLPVTVGAEDLSRRPLDHQDYDRWNTMSRSAISNDGKWVLYMTQNGAIDGEATLHLHQAETGRQYVIERGADARFTDDSRFAIYRVTPEKKKLKQMRKEKKAASELPKPSLQILELDTGKLVTLENVRSFQIPEQSSDWLACLLEPSTGPNELKESDSSARESYEVTSEGLRRPEKPLKLKSREQLARERGEIEPEAAPESKPQEKESERKASVATEEESGESRDRDEKKEKPTGTPLILIHLETGVRRTFPAVIGYEFSKNGKTFAFTTSVKPPDEKTPRADASGGDTPTPHDVLPVDGVHVIELDSFKRATIASGVGEYKNLALSDDGSQVAFLTNRDDYESKTTAWSVYHWTLRTKQAKRIAGEGDLGVRAGWWVSPNSNQRFSENGQRLYFETAPIPAEVIKERSQRSDSSKAAGKSDEADDGEKAKLDIWHWRDPQLQPQQLLQAEQERRRDYLAVYNLKSKKLIHLADRDTPDIDIDYRATSNLAVANTNMRYRKMLSWDVPGFQDAYLVNLDTGKRELVLEKEKWSVSLSPGGKFVTWFDQEQKKWFAKSTKGLSNQPTEISKGIPYPLQDELHDTPNLASAYGAAGWMADDRGLLIYDRYDIWRLDPEGKTKPVCVTNGFGRKNDLRFRYRSLDPEERSIDPSKLLVLEAFNQQTKASGFYSLLIAAEQVKPKTPSPEPELRQLILLDEDLGGLQKAKASDSVIFTRSTFRRCPDLWSSQLDFKQIHRVSDINPQQDDYSWGAAELVRWDSADGEKLDGILIKPDGFDPTKKYPMLVYFYERNSDNLHRYYPPAAGRSIICHSFYVSRGYLIFIPDIPYKVGEPGRSAANAILPGVEHLIAQGFVDKDRIGMQGHSWGGYQTAYLVTQTDLFACAESGAPVSNMTSAYGGIRWGTGMSRMFQYERTQSRIGEDLWAARDKYVANSPLFFADRINTPLLILHNDQDGAVPWYQGIELFVALRRLEKPAWMLNYNDEPHWVMDEYNRRDFAIRMQQFFDHYLLDAPEPEWMAVGIPAVQKGTNYGLELLEPEQPNP